MRPGQASWSTGVAETRTAAPAEISGGLDIAREYGVADLDESGEWVVGDLSRLNHNY
jgi:hypothetical protein